MIVDSRMKTLTAIALLLLGAHQQIDAFAPPRFAGSSSSLSSRTLAPTAGIPQWQKQQADATPSYRYAAMRQQLNMAASDNFDESKYTETAWSSISSLPKVSDFYETTTVEAPLLLDMMLNPNKHGGNEKAEAAKKVVDRALSKAGVDMKQLRSELEQHFSKQARHSSSGSAQKAMGRSLQKVIDTARITQNVLGDSFISTEGLLLALVKEDDVFTREALLRQSVSYTDVLKVIQQIREKNGPAISRSAETMYDALLKYGIDFTERAREGKLDPVIGRDDEIRRTIQILSRRTKNNPVLIGDPVR
jgi:ATP-dependent Clp protease ATP-binding subunit ClpB